MASEDGHDAHLWKAAVELGIAGLLVDAEYGGIGAGPIEIEIVMEEAGAALMPAPLLSSAVMATELVADSRDDAAKARLLPGFLSGATIATVAITGEKGLWTPEDVSVAATAHGGIWRVSGIASYVLWAGIANVLLVVARSGAGLRVYEVDPKAQGVPIEPLKSWDRTLRLSRISFDAALATRIAGTDETTIARMLDVARVALAGEQAGAARKMFDMTVEYLKTRIQFGRPIGGFQALKHMAADLLLEVESATSAARQAARALAEGSPDKNVLVSLAAFACADAFAQVAATAIQMHGGIAFTWEHPAHLYLRRARADAQLLGASARYREDYVSALEKAS